VQFHPPAHLRYDACVIAKQFQRVTQLVH
jgi:hypothetical protein